MIGVISGQFIYVNTQLSTWDGCIIYLTLVITNTRCGELIHHQVNDIYHGTGEIH